MCFLSNFGCRITFMCSVNFWHQQDSKSLFKGSISHVTSPLRASGRPLYRVRPLRAPIFKKGIIFFSCWRWVPRVIPRKRNLHCIKEKFYVHKSSCQCVSLGECDVKRVFELGLIFEVSASNMAATDFVCLILKYGQWRPWAATPIRNLYEKPLSPGLLHPLPIVEAMRVAVPSSNQYQ